MRRADAMQGAGPLWEVILLAYLDPEALWEGTHEALLPLALGFEYSFLSLTILKGSLCSLLSLPQPI